MATTGAEGPTSPVPVRSDVRRNLAALLAAARTVFATAGVRAPAKEITDLAGVGVGTLYRHFPRRSDLIVAVLRQELDDCVAAAVTLNDTLEPSAALTAWVGRFTGLVSTKRGLAEALHSTDPAYDGLPASLLADLEPALATILERGVATGEIRPDVTAHEILVAVALLSHPVPDDPLNAHLVALFLAGLSLPAPARRGRPTDSQTEG